MNKLDIENIFIDLDGTTLKSDKTISSKTLSVLNELKKRNINIFVATGRPIYMIKQELEELDISEYVITINGSIITDTKNNKVLYSKKMDLSSLYKIEKYLLDNKIPYLVYTDKEMFYNCDENNQWVTFLKKRINSLNKKYRWELKKIDSNFKISEHTVVKLLIPTFEMNKNSIDSICLWFTQEMPLYILLASQENVLDIIPSKSSKGEGIRFLANLLTLNLDKTLAFGDANNDIPMFESVKYSVVMSNGVNELKKVATHITNSNDDEGIYNFIKDKIL